MHLALQDLFFRVSVVGNVDEVFNYGRINLFIFARNKHSGHSDELQLWPVDWLFSQVSVDQIHSQVEAFRDQLEFQMNFDQPINQYRSHFLIDVKTVAKIAVLRNVVPLRFKQVIVNVYWVLSTVLGILSEILIHRVNHGFKVILTSFFKLSISTWLLGFPSWAIIRCINCALQWIFGKWMHVFPLLTYQRHGIWAVTNWWLSSLLIRLM